MPMLTHSHILAQCHWIWSFFFEGVPSNIGCSPVDVVSKTGCLPVSDVVVVEAVGGKVEEASGVVESKDFGFMTISPRQHSSYVEYRNLDFLKPVFHIIGERFC